MAQVNDGFFMAKSFVTNCEERYTSFSSYAQYRANLVVAKPKLSIEYEVVMNNLEVILKILSSKNFVGERGAIIGYRGNIVVVPEWKIWHREEKTLKVRCSLCKYGIARLANWVDHVNGMECICANPNYYIKQLDQICMLNNMQPKTFHLDLPHPYPQ